MRPVTSGACRVPAVGAAARSHVDRAPGAVGGILGQVAVGSGQDGPVDRARDALDHGAAWRARDILLAHVEQENDTEALSMLGEVLNDMGDLPRAGAVWFAAGARGPQVDRAVAAWREQSRDDFAVMWGSLPASAKQEPRPPRVEALREKALAVEPSADEADGDGSADAQDEDGTDAAQVIAWILAAAFVVFAVVGAVTVLGWLVPG